MAQATIRKGFFFYFGLFVLLVVAVFLLCLVIMMFNPGATVLWMKYFTANNTSKILTLSDENKTAINYASIDEITVNCEYANVIVQANEELKDGKGVYIVNRAKGFAVAKGAKSFAVNTSLNGSELIIDITEPNGFLFFSKKIDVVINCYQNWSFGDLKLNVNSTGESDVYFGGQTLKNDTEISLGNVKVETAKGSVYVTEHANFNGDVDIVANTGRIKTLDTKFLADHNVKLSTNTGRINIDEIDVGTSELEIRNDKGAAEIGKITADTVFVICVQGNFVFDKIDGNLDFKRCDDKLVSPSIRVNEVTGDFYLQSTNDATKISPDAYVGKVGGNVDVAATDGKLTIGEVFGNLSIVSAGRLTEDVTIAEENTNTIAITNKNGAMKLTFKGDVGPNVTLNNETARITINFTTQAKFLATAKKFSNSSEDVSDGNITISIDGSAVSYEKKSEIQVNGTSALNGDIDIFTDNKITYNLVA